MPEPQHAEDGGPKASGAAASAGPPASPAARLWSWAREHKALVLFCLGVLLGVAAFVLYPSAAAEVPGPAVPWVGVQSKVAIAEIDYSVRVSSGRTRIDIAMQRDPLGPASVSRAVSVILSPVLPYGMGRTVLFGHSPGAEAAVHFTVNAADSGMSFNGTTAAVAIPRIVYHGPGTPALVVTYPIPSASSYDWSSLPPIKVTSSSATWTTATGQADVGVQAQASAPGQVAVGINHARQTTDSNKTFAAGALLGLAGGAILSAVQEALHARDSRDNASPAQGHPAG